MNFGFLSFPVNINNAYSFCVLPFFRFSTILFRKAFGNIIIQWVMRSITCKDFNICNPCSFKIVIYISVRIVNIIIRCFCAERTGDISIFKRYYTTFAAISQ